jgi:SH3 domain-containing protein
MKGFLLFLSLGGATLYTLLVFTHDALQDGKAETTLAVQNQSSHPVAQQLSSWGTYLPSGSPSQKPESPLATSQQPALLPQPSPSQDSARMPGADHQFAASEDKAPAAKSDSAEQEPERAKVVLAAEMHSEGSVSSPMVRIYRPGTELQVIGRVDGWFQVSDPVTHERGWIFEKYLSSIESPSLTQAAMESTTTEPLPAKPALQKSKKRIRSAKSAVRVVAQSDPWNGRWSGRADRPRGFGLFMFRPFARFAAQRANSPVLFAGPQ